METRKTREVSNTKEFLFFQMALQIRDVLLRLLVGNMGMIRKCGLVKISKECAIPCNVRVQMIGSLLYVYRQMIYSCDDD